MFLIDNSIIFIKNEESKWFVSSKHQFDLPKSKLEMSESFGDFLDFISQGENMILIHFTNEQKENYEYKLELFAEGTLMDEEGGYYKLVTEKSKIQMDVWVDTFFKHYFGKMPKDIYCFLN